MAREREEMVVCPDAQYSDDSFRVLADNWNDRMRRDHPEALLEMKPVMVLRGDSINDVSTRMWTDVFENFERRPCKFLYPIQQGGNHWVGIVVEVDKDQNVTITANDPLGESEGRRFEVVGELLRSLTDKFEATGLSAEYKFDDHALLQPDHVSCGPYVFENMTAYATGARRKPAPDTMQLRQEQLAMMQEQVGKSANAALIVKEASFSQKVDDVLKILGEQASTARYEYKSDVHKILQGLSDADKKILNEGGYSAVFLPIDKGGDTQTQVLNRILFHARGHFPEAIKFALGTPVGGAMTSPRAESRASSGGGSPGGGGGGGPSPVLRMPLDVEVEGCMNALAIGLMAKYKNTNSVIQTIARDLDSGMEIKDIVAKTKIPTLTKQVELFAKLYSNPDTKPLIKSLLVIGEKVMSAGPTATPVPVRRGAGMGR